MFRKFREWQEEKFTAELIQELERGLRDKKYIHDPKYHENIVKKLRVMGLGEDADELEMVKPSEDDMDFYRMKPKSPITFGPDYNLKKAAADAKLARDTYDSHIRHLIEKIKTRVRG